MQVTTHTTKEVKTIDVYDPSNIQMVCSEHDKIKIGRNHQDGSTVIPFQPHVMANSVRRHATEKFDSTEH